MLMNLWTLISSIWYYITLSYQVLKTPDIGRNLLTYRRILNTKSLTHLILSHATKRLRGPCKYL